MTRKAARAGAAAPALNGATALVGGGATFRVWAPKRKRVEVVFAGSRAPLELARGADGAFTGFSPEAQAGDLYRFRLDGEGLFPDPASRFQPEGPHGPSQIVDPEHYRWTMKVWPGLSPHGQVIYELHLGTFTQEGTWEAAARELPRLAELGITAVEVMPVAEFPGRFGWGYDGVYWGAPSRLYGSPDEARRFVETAHSLGLGVLLDVVYNHFGPDGNYLKEYSDAYFTARHETDWGEAINYDGEGSAEVRRFACEIAARWIGEYRFDGLRLDATQNVYDSSPRHVLADITRAAREAAGGRGILVFAENEPQEMRLVVDPKRGGYGMDGLWNDDFHHCLRVALTGMREAYYFDYTGGPQEIVSLLKRGTLYQGQRYAWQRKGRGTSTAGVAGPSFVQYLENHDQVANTSYRGARLAERCDAGLLRAMTAVLLLSPGTPLLFQGQEWGGGSRFTFFADHKPGLRELVWEGRRKFMTQFASTKDIEHLVADPADPATFEACKLKPGPHAEEWLALHRDLLRLRKEDPVFAAQDFGRIDGAVLGPDLLCARYFGDDGDDRLVFVNLGAVAELRVQPEPLLAPPDGRRWHMRWSSEAAEYGGSGTPAAEPRPRWLIPARSTVVLAAREASHDS